MNRNYAPVPVETQIVDPSLAVGNKAFSEPERLVIGRGKAGEIFVGDIWQKTGDLLNLHDHIDENPVAQMMVVVQGADGRSDVLLVDASTGKMMSVDRASKGRNAIKPLWFNNNGSLQPAFDGSLTVGCEWEKFGIVEAVVDIRSIYGDVLPEDMLPAEDSPIAGLMDKVRNRLTGGTMGTSPEDLIPDTMNPFEYMRGVVADIEKKMGDAALIGLVKEVQVEINAEAEDVFKGLPVESFGQKDPLNPDRTLGYPNVLYHSSKDENFRLDVERNHRNTRTSLGARTGAGLYLGPKEVAEQFGNGKLVEIVPSNIKLLDLDAPDASKPISEEFKKAYIESTYNDGFDIVRKLFPSVEDSTIATIWDNFSNAEGLISKADVHYVATKAKDAGKVTEFFYGNALAKEIASQINMLRIMQVDGVSLREIFATYDSVNGQTRFDEEVTLDIAPIIDFLTERGIDGAKTAQRFDGQQGVVLWKLDNVGDKQTWKSRQLEK